MDAVDNSGQQLPDVGEFSDPVQPSGAVQSSGSDLAREALHAAQAAARSRGGRRGGTGPGGSGRSVVGKGAGAANRRRRRRWSGAHPDDRDPQPFGRLVGSLATERGWQQRLRTGQVFARWSQLVGVELAEHARPTALRDGELTVQADSTAWATQLRLLQRQLLARIAAGVGDGVVRKLKVAAPAAPSWRHGPRHVRGRGPRDTYG